MQPSAAPAPSTKPLDFAGLLMDLAAPEAKKPPARDFDGLEDDVAVLSYENAVRLHGRYRAGEATTRPRLIRDVPPETPAPAPPTSAATHPQVNRKLASVTVRLCSSESERLRQRAAESGLTVSEYLRSCVFEVETLRAQVKEALAALRSAPQKPIRRAWWRRYWMFRRDSKTAA